MLEVEVVDVTPVQAQVVLVVLVEVQPELLMELLIRLLQQLILVAEAEALVVEMV
jgi:hypothetical protein